MNNRHSPCSPNSRRQRGAALVIALIILLVLTVMGISGIRHATLEESMAFNVQAKSITFQAAESALDAFSTAYTTITTQAIDTGTSTANYSAVVNPPGQATTVTATVAATYTGPGGLASGYSTDKFDLRDLSVQATADMTAASARSIHQLGVTRVSPRN